MGIQAKRRARIEIESSAKGVDKGVADARKKLTQFQKDVRKIAKSIGGGIGTVGAGIMASIGFAAGGGIMGIAGGIVGDVLDVEKSLTRLQISGSMSKQEIALFRAELMRVSDATGVSRKALLEGAQAYVAMTGDAKGAQAALQLFGEVNKATGSSMADIASTAAAMRQNLKIDPKDFRAAFDVLVTQGKAGAVEMKDLAQQLANVAPQFAQFASSRSVSGLAEMGAMLQVVRQGFGDADEAATGFRGMMTEISRHQKKLEKAGVKVIDPKTGKMRDLLQIVKDIGSNVQLMKPGALLEALGEEKAARAMTMLLENMKAVEDLRDKSVNSNTVAKDNAIYQESAAGRLEKAGERMKNAFAAAFTPERIEKFAAAVEHAVALLSHMAEVLNTVGQFFDNLAPSHESKVKDELRGQSFQEDLLGIQTKTPAQKRKRARQLYQQASEVMMRGDDASDTEGAMAEAWRARAEQLVADANKADPWGAGQFEGASSFSKNDSTLPAKIGEAVAKGIVEGMMKVQVSIDGAGITDASNNSIRQHTGGRAR